MAISATSVKKRRNTVVFILASILLVILSIFLFTQYNRHKITVVNNSKSYTVIYKPTKEFSNTLSSLGIWDKDAIFVTKNKSVPIKNIIISFTDIQQKHKKQLDKNNHILWSSSADLRDSTLNISIQMSKLLLETPTLKNNFQRNIDKQITYLVLSSVYDSTNTLNTQNAFKLKSLPDQTFTPFVKENDTNPFFIQLKK